jgi:chromosome partitioning protein
MKIISLINQKGGSGKTNLACNLSVAAALEGKRVALFDMDPQATATSWFDEREAHDPKSVSSLMAHPIVGARLDRGVKDAESDGREMLFIDTPPHTLSEVQRAAKLSDLCVIPCRPTIDDRLSTERTIEMLRLLETPFVIALTQEPPGSVQHQDVRAFLAQKSSVCVLDQVVFLRVDYSYSRLVGQGVQEYAPRSKAAAEIQNLYSEITERMV